MTLSWRCPSCKEGVIEYSKADDWLALMSFVRFLYLEEQITEATYSAMLDHLMTFKNWAVEAPEENEASWWIIVVACRKGFEYRGTDIIRAKDVQSAKEETWLGDDEYIELVLGPFDKRPAGAFCAKIPV